MEGYGNGYMNRRGYTNDSTKSSYGGNGYPDYVSRPESYITSAERIVEHVRTPVVVTEYGYSTPTRVEPAKDYVVYNDKRRVPTSPIYDQPQRIEEFITDASRPARPGLLQSPTNWRNPPNSGNTGYGEYTNYNNSDWNKQNGYSIRDENPKDYYRRNDGYTEPAIINKDGWERPGHKGWAAPPSYDTKLSGPTSDIGKAVEVLKEAVKPSLVTTAAPQPWFTGPVSTVPKRDTYTETIGSMEAPRRYGSFNLSSRPFRGGETYTGSMDNREAARRY